MASSTTTRSKADEQITDSGISSSSGKKKGGAGTGLNDVFIGFFAVAFLLSLSLNILHSLGSFDNDGDTVLVPGTANRKVAVISSSSVSKTRSALHSALSDFATNKNNNKGPTTKKVVNFSDQDLVTSSKRLNTMVRKKGATDDVDKQGNDEARVGDEHNTHDIPAEILQQQGDQQENSGDDDEGDNSNDSDLMSLAELDCTPFEHGTNSHLTEEETQDMVYWQEIKSDSLYMSPFKKINLEYTKSTQKTRYLTFEPDGGGWNNIRMSMESVIALAIAMGRTLVMPPQKKMYLLGQNQKGQQHHFSFADFFPIEEMARDNAAFDVISMEEYLTVEGLGGNLVHHETGEVVFPPGNRTNWDGINQDDYDLLRGYLRNVSMTAKWSPGQCLPAFPSSGNHEDVELLKEIIPKAEKLSHINKPPELSAPDPVFRLADTLAGRTELCVYDESFQQVQIVHFQMNHKAKLRLLVHFYAFLFFEDWREDLWMKRFVRDHLRYLSEIQCAAGRVVAKLRKHVRSRQDGHGDSAGTFDSFHIRRGDFQFKTTRISAEEIVQNTEAELIPNSTIFIATDERDKKFFQPLRDRYDIWFLDDFAEELEGVNTNYYGMIDQLVASKGRIFFGCFFSTFTGYINRIRGYHSTKEKQPGFEDGLLPTTYYYATLDKKTIMHEYSSIRSGFFNREYPSSWRGIDEGIAELAELSSIEV